MAPEPKPKPPVKDPLKDAFGTQENWAKSTGWLNDFWGNLGNVAMAGLVGASGSPAAVMASSNPLIKGTGKAVAPAPTQTSSGVNTNTIEGILAASGGSVADPRTVPPTDPEINPGDYQGGGSGVGSIYDPLFAGINSQRKLVNQRYLANQGNIVNLYGQITAARKQDINSTNKLYEGLRAAATNRSTDINAQLDTREAARLQQQQQLMQSLGLSGMPTPANDNATREADQQRAMTTATNENWTGYLGAQQANAQGALNNDINMAQFQRGADLQKLRDNRAGAMDQLFQQEQSIKSQKAKAQAQVAAAQSAATVTLQKALIAADTQVQKAQIAAAAKNFTAQGPVMAGITLGIQNGIITPEESSGISNTISDIFRRFENPSAVQAGATSWSPSVMMKALNKDDTYTSQLSLAQQQIIMGIIQNMKY